MKKKQFMQVINWRIVLPLLLLLANGWAWFILAGRVELVEAQPILHEHIAEVRQHWQAGDAVGETFEVTVTDLQAMETVVWFLDGRGVPFSHPQVAISPDRVWGGGLVQMGGLEMFVSGEADVFLVNGRLEANIIKISMGNANAPQFVLDVVAQGMAIYDTLQLPIEITEIEQREGEVYLRGVYVER